MRKFIAFYILVSYIINIVYITNVNSFFETTDFKINNIVSGPYYFNPGDTFSIDYSNSNNLLEDIKEVFFNIDFGNNSGFLYNGADQKTIINGVTIMNPIPSSAYSTVTGFKYEITDASNLTISNSIDFNVSRSSNNYNAFTVQQNISTYSNTLDTWIESKKVSDNSLVTGTITNKTIYVNVKPHIVDYYFTLADGTTTTSTIQGSSNENINLIVKVKDYNGCSNVDGSTVTANLSLLGLLSNETLVYDSCDVDGKTAIFRKTGISTIEALGDKIFTYSSFSAVDEDGNINDPNDTNTTFDDEDKKTNLVISVVAADAPIVTNLLLTDNYIGGTGELSTNISFSGSLDGTSKVSLDSCTQTDSNKIFQDWTTYTTPDSQTANIDSTKLIEGSNSLFVCIKNNDGNIGSFNVEITKDITAPSISGTSYSPASVILDNSSIEFQCNENGTYKIDRITPSFLNVHSYSSIIADTLTGTIINNADLELGTNDFTITCKDEAGNTTEYANITISKQEPTPSMAGELTLFEDQDIDLDGLDGRDIHITWNTAVGTAFLGFESWRIYLLPSNVILDTEVHNYIKLIADSAIGDFSGDVNLTTDSQGNTLVGGGEYKAYITIMGTTGMLGEEGSSTAVTLISDIVENATILSAKFTSDTILELTTDTTLDTVLSFHSGTLISYEIDGVPKIGISIDSVDGTKLNVIIPSIGNTYSTGTNLTIGNGAIHSAGGGYNNTLTPILTITDGLNPIFSSFIKNTAATYSTFYNPIIEFVWNISEELIGGGESYLEFIRTGGNTDSGTNHKVQYSSSADLANGVHTKIINLNQDDTENVVLTCGTTYKAIITAKDLVGNTSISGEITNLSFDNCAPSIPTQTELILESTLTPTLEWSSSIDDSGNGSGIKDYTITVYNGTGCSGGINQTHTINTNSQTLTSLGVDQANYSWKVLATDNMNNASSYSSCDDFTVNTTIPAFSNEQINDTTISSTTYTRQGDNITITADITNTDIDNIWIDLVSLTGNASHSGVLCSSSPIDGITCGYIPPTVTYNLTTGTGISDGIKQVQFISQNISGGNEQTKIIYTTSDSTEPSVAPDTISSPTGIVGGDFTDIIWDQLKITDTIGINNIKIEYSTGANIQTEIYNGPNTSPYEWNLTGLESGNDYKLQITAYDLAGNNTIVVFPIFEIDRIAPVVPSDTVIYPNGGEIISGINSIDILWNSGSITDVSLAVNPITIEYTTDDGSNWILLADNEVNDGVYTWNNPNLNSTTVKIKLTATDSVGNQTTDISDLDFIIDSLNPDLTFSYVNTPVNSSKINNSGIDITANTSDTNLFKTFYRFTDITNSQYWNGSIYTTDVWNEICLDTTTLGTNTNCNSINVTINPIIIDGNNYRLELKSIDETGNETISIPLDYIGDTVNPSLTINTLSGTYFNSTINIDGSSSDTGSLLSSVKIQIKRLNDGFYWDGNDFVSGLNTLNTNTSDGYSNWNYDFSPLSGTNEQYELKVISYDNTFKSNNFSESIITINQDTVNPNMVTPIFMTPTSGEILIGGGSKTITWDTGNITDTDSGLASSTPILLEYFNGSIWQTIDNIDNTGSYNWSVPSIDTNIAKLRITVTDNVGNTTTELGDSFIIDSTPPSILSVETRDSDANGEIDGVLVTISESILDSTIIGNLNEYLFDNGIGNPVSFETGLSADDDEFILNFSNIGNTSTTPTLTYTKGSLTDLAGKFLENDTVLSLDKAIPRLLSSNIYDDNSDGIFDKIIAIYSENILTSTDTTSWSINNIITGMSINSVTTNSNTAIINLNGSSYDTSVGTMDLSFTSNSNWKDLNNNQAGSISNIVIGDLAKPVILSSEYTDNDSNYIADKVTITLSENVTGFNIGDFVLTGLIENNGSITNNIITINLTEAGVNDSGIIASFDYTNNSNLKDSSNNFVNTISSFSINDKIAPELLSKVTKDSDGNGQIDKVILTFSEDIGADFSSFIAEVDGYTLSGTPYVKNGNTIVEISVVEKSTSDTGATPQFRISSNSSLKDTAGNNVEITNLENLTDSVGPIIIGARYDETTSKIFLTFSENIDNTDFITTNFTLNNAGVYTIDTVNSGEASITLGGETITYSSTEISFASNSVRDTSGNLQTGTIYTKISAPIIINEIMISDIENNNYIELKNLSSTAVDLDGWTVAGVTIVGTTNIDADGYILISETIQATSIINVIPDIVDTNLDLSGVQISLNNGTIDIDYAKLDTGLNDTATPKSIERKSNPGDGTLAGSWYQAQESNGFDDSIPYGTPGGINVFDATAPTINSYFPNDDNLLPMGSLDLSFDYTENIGGLGVDITSDTLTLNKYNTGTTSFDIDSIGSVDSGSKTITTTKSTYPISNLTYGKYQATFTIDDLAGNTVTKTLIFYIDEFEFILNSNNLDIGTLTIGDDNISSNEIIVIIKTVGAGFNLNIDKSTLLTTGTDNIGDWNGTNGFGFDNYKDENGIISNYSTSLTAISSNNIGIISKNINTDGIKNIFTYKFKYGANINTTQEAGTYNSNIDFDLGLTY